MRTIGSLIAVLLFAQGADAVKSKASLLTVWQKVASSDVFVRQVDAALPLFCKGTRGQSFGVCKSYVRDAIMCLELSKQFDKLKAESGLEQEKQHCKAIDREMPTLTQLSAILAAPRAHRKDAAFLQQMTRVETWARSEVKRAPEDELAKEMTHDLEMNFNKIAPFGKEDTAKELQDHAAKTQDTLVDAVENAEVAEIKRAVFRALTRLRAATIKEFDTIARLETQAIDAYNDAHHYRAENPLAHLHEDEAPVETDKLKSFH